MNYLVETKQEYTVQLINILAPLLYEGISSLYTEARNISTDNDVLKNFQSLLRSIPKLNIDLIKKEELRILNRSNCSDWLEDLVKAIIKSNIILLTTTSPNYSLKYLKDETYKHIEFSDFIHKCYIECGREFREFLGNLER